VTQKKANTPAKPKKRWKFEVGFGGVLGIGAVGTLVMAWAFILGVLVGRGYKPESVIPDLGGIVAPHLPSLPSPRTVLQAEDLHFYDALQEERVQSRPERRAPSPKPRPEEERQTVLQASPQATVQAITEPKKQESQTVSRPEPVAGSRPEPKPEPEPSAADPRFDYVYQTAAFQQSDQARALHERIAGAGIDSSIEVSTVKGETWYRVLVSLRGTTTDAVEVKKKLQAFGIQRPFIRSKKPL
jgi:cell division protein FtsN